jgi:hypothetical protein
LAGLLPYGVSMSVTHLVSMEIRGRMSDRMLSTLRERALVAMLDIVVVVYMAAEVFRAVKPRASANKDTSGKPFRTVIPHGSAAIGSVIVITIGAYRWRSYIDRNLRLGSGSGGDEKTDNCE